MCGCVRCASLSVRPVQDAFAMVDVDGSGEIDKGELKGLAKMLGMQMSDKDLVTALPLIRSHRNNVD